MPDSLQETHEALLDAAVEEFAEKGYQMARVRSIADRAGANVAAINYHFGGKERLYLAVLEKGIFERVKRFPILNRPSDKAPFEQRFHQSVHNVLKRFMARGPSALLPRILIRELNHPTAAIDMLIRRVAAPQLDQMTALIQERVGPDVPESDVRKAAFSIVGQCLFYLLAKPLVTQLAPELYDENALIPLASHIATFSLGGLDALREQHT